MGEDFLRWWTEYSEHQSYKVTDLMTGYQMARRDATAAYEAGGDEARQRAEQWAHRAGVFEGLAETAWGLIANAGNGDWTKETPVWQAAAERWRDRYHEALALAADPQPTEAGGEVG